jgi:hypothetical protein
VLAASIFTKLSADAAVTALIGSGDACRLYPGIAPAGVAVPYVVWQEISSSPDLTLGEASASARRMVQFSCVAATYIAAVALASAIVAALDNATLAAGEVCLSCSATDGFSEATDQFLRIVDADFFAAPG